MKICLTAGIFLLLSSKKNEINSTGVFALLSAWRRSLDFIMKNITDELILCLWKPLWCWDNVGNISCIWRAWLWPQWTTAISSPFFQEKFTGISIRKLQSGKKHATFWFHVQKDLGHNPIQLSVVDAASTECSPVVSEQITLPWGGLFDVPLHEMHHTTHWDSYAKYGKLYMIWLLVAWTGRSILRRLWREKIHYFPLPFFKLPAPQ